MHGERIKTYTASAYGGVAPPFLKFGTRGMRLVILTSTSALDSMKESAVSIAWDAGH